jgi:hypothetical protein
MGVNISFFHKEQKKDGLKQEFFEKMDAISANFSNQSDENTKKILYVLYALEPNSFNKLLKK